MGSRMPYELREMRYNEGCVRGGIRFEKQKIELV